MRKIEPGFFVHSFEGKGPVLLEVPHSGLIGVDSLESAPELITSRLRFDSKSVRQTVVFGCDIAVPTMSGYCDLICHLNVSGVINSLARVFMDTNRDRNEFSSLAVGGGRAGANHHGVIWARTLLTDVDLNLPVKSLEDLVASRCEKIYTMPFTRDEFEELLLAFYDPYHAAIREHHKRIVSECGLCIHLALHSLPPFQVASINGGYVTGKVASRGRSKGQLPDIILIHNNFKAADKAIINKIRMAFEAEQLIVEDGRGPFLGDRGVTKIYGNPKDGIHVVGIEHVTHNVEIGRHCGSLAINVEKAKRFRKVYRSAVMNLM